MKKMKKHQFIKVYIPADMMKTYKGRQHQNPEKWTNLIYYDEKQKHEILQNQVVNELVGCGQYQNNTFYKIGGMCKKDPIWDYYRILKKHPHQQVAVKATNMMTQQRNLKQKHMGFRKIIYPKDKPKIITFQ